MASPAEDNREPAPTAARLSRLLFNSAAFLLGFLPATLLVYYLLAGWGQGRASAGWLVLASLFFYGWWNPVHVPLILASIAFNYTLVTALNARPAPAAARRLLMVGIAVNLLVLGGFKYLGFAVHSVGAATGMGWTVHAIVLPLAISFFTFQQIACLVDAWRGQGPDHGPVRYALFVLFFPHLIAGPLVHHGEILRQFDRPETYRPQSDNLAAGLSILVIGLFKKVVLADGAAAYVTPVFDAAAAGTPVLFFEAWSAALAFTLQIYFDFSGYSDMAIGVARMFNITLPVNFASPYKATNIAEFWRRWHITLSRFLRNYLYIPLGGNRRGPLRRHANLLITMGLGGLWHGAGWTFVAWGLLHGFYLGVFHAWRGRRPTTPAATAPSPRVARIVMGRCLGWMLTMLAVVVGWVLFRAATPQAALAIYQGMAGLQGAALPAQILAVWPGLMAVITPVAGAPLLGEGRVMGVFEMLSLFALMAGLTALPATAAMGPRLRWLAVCAGGYFVLHAVFLAGAAVPFLYFQF